jgi:hypothetical protein
VLRLFVVRLIVQSGGGDVKTKRFIVGNFQSPN